MARNSLGIYTAKILTINVFGIFNTKKGLSFLDDCTMWSSPKGREKYNQIGPSVLVSWRK